MTIRTRLAGGALALALGVAGVGAALAGDLGAGAATGSTAGYEQLQDAPRDRGDCPNKRGGGGGEGQPAPSESSPQL